MPRGFGGGVGEGDRVRTVKKRSTSMKMRRLRGEGKVKKPKKLLDSPFEVKGKTFPRGINPGRRGTRGKPAPGGYHT